MKYLNGAFALGLLLTRAFAQSVVTVKLPTCIPGGDRIGTGLIPGPAPTGPTTEVINVTVTNSLGSVTVEPITQVVTPGASATEPSTFVSVVTTTNSLGSTLVETTTSVTTPPIQFTTPKGTSPAAGPVEPTSLVGATTPMASTTPNVPTTPVGSTAPAGSAPVGPASVGPASVEPSSVGPSPGGPSSVESTPVGPASVGPASVGPPSVGPTTPVPPGTTTAPVGNSPTTPSTPASTNLCPAPPNTPYTDSNGKTYIVQCTADYPGNDLQASNEYTSLLGCIEYCDTLAGCIGVSFGAPNSCYPKYSITGIDYDYGNFDSAYVNTYQENAQTTTTFGVNPATSAAPPPPVTTTSTGPAPIQTIGGTPSCPANNGSYYETVFDNTYDITCGLDLVGLNGTVPFHADSYVACLESCDLLEGCLAVTYSGSASASTTNCVPWYNVTGTTYVAGSELMAGQNVNGPNTGADTSVSYCDPDGANQTIITDTFGYNYYVGCGQQYNCPDLVVGVLTTNMEACIDYCSICQGCLAVGYTGGHPVQAPNSPNCFTFGSYNNTLSYNATVNYAVLQTPQNP